jgi:hypothetical protein
MKVRIGVIVIVLVMGWLVFCRATETNLTPWYVVSSNRLTEIRQEFYALPRPVIERWQTVTQRGPVIFFGWSSDMEGTKLVLTTNAATFISDNVAKGTNEFRGEVDIAGALWPILLDTNHSGEATAILVGLRNNPFSVETDAFLNTGYCAPTNRGSWNADGPGVRQRLRDALRSELWLDAYGAPAAVRGGKIRSGSCYVEFTNCTDEAATPP